MNSKSKQRLRSKSDHSTSQSEINDLINHSYLGVVNVTDYCQGGPPQAENLQPLIADGERRINDLLDSLDTRLDQAH